MGVFCKRMHYMRSLSVPANALRPFKGMRKIFFRIDSPAKKMIEYRANNTEAMPKERYL